MEPLFCALSEDFYERFVVVEPGDAFYKNAVCLADNNAKIHCIHAFFDEETAEQMKVEFPQFDLIVCSCLLHEIENPQAFLQWIKAVCGEKTVVHINVPNAFSFHRILGKYMNLLENEHDFSDRNTIFQQASVFDMEKLSTIVKAQGFRILDSGSFFIRPFSHAQMYQIMQAGIIDEKVLDGLYRMAEAMPQFGSEIYLNCSI